MKKLGLKAFFVMMPTLQKRPKFGMKMTKFWPFIDRFPSNHYRMSFLIHKNNAVKSKRKRKQIEETRSIFFDLMTTLQKQPKFGMKMAESQPFMDQFPTNHHRFF